MIKVGLTGGIGSGKTTVAKFFRELGIPVYVADVEARKLMDTSKSIQKKLIEAFGAVAYINGELNRQYLAHLVFNDKEKLKIINSIIHPKVSKHFSKWLKLQHAPYSIQENAIIFENNKADEFDYIISVTAPLDVRINRVITRDNTSKEQVLARINNQWDEEKKNKLADFVIENIDLSETKKQVKSIHQKLLKISKNR
ncbi:dephospho-CoA kinase [Aureibaculum sp. 2210JD6-5]|uniref:dephospho-CoA kinase n=1 Tax=Aureibaculum sp. 2210JD6-5 TaxID=3103957 RepID=UPI002AAD3F95|nr:dephospho-CoA kinase [Aureibaculum sp. 2210JD6-5]MDY7395533.1 dephospho-CoA kinase [Aureibaculum sp. 2210JD6-5]